MDMFGGGGSAPKPPPPPAPMLMVDPTDPAFLADARLRVAKAAARSGRMSTRLSGDNTAGAPETLGTA